jgi:hypothetical protein
MSEYGEIIKCVEEHFDNRFTFISTTFLYSHSPSYKNSKFTTKMEMVILDNIDNESHTIRIKYKTHKILINKINKIIRDKRGDVIDNVIKGDE